MDKVKVSTYHGMTAFVNPSNPGFSSYFRGKRVKSVEVYGLITDGTKSWRESFKVSNKKAAAQQIAEVIQFFNETRRPDDKEKERTFVGLYEEDKEVARYPDDCGMSGWLDPEGVFHPCGFGEHVQYALEIFNNEESTSFRPCYKEEMDELALNQHIPMSTEDMSSNSFISILGKLTPSQVEWFNRFFYKLSSAQRTAVARAAKEQNIQLKYDW